MRVFDVDDDYQGTFAPERDAIVVNGHRLDPYASGADNQWSINTFLVPTDYLVLPNAGGSRSVGFPCRPARMPCSLAA